MILKGKGFYIWKIRECENGENQAIVEAAVRAGLTHVLIKIADGAYSYNLDPSGVDPVPGLVQALRKRGIQAWGWQYLYGKDPVGEANKAIQRIHQCQVDGFVMDVEKEFKEPGKQAAAVKYLDRLRTAFPDLPLGLSSYRFPSYHPQIPWREFLEHCDYNMPQVYWVLAHNPVDQLNRSVQEFQAITPYRPIVPTGSAYKSGSWQATPEEVTAFLRAAQELNLSGTNFWEWGNCRRYLPDTWQAISDYNWPGGPALPDIVQQYIDALNSRDVNRIINLYTPNAVHTNAARTVQGVTAIKAWYENLLTQVLPDAKFTLTGQSGSGNTRQLTWTAKSDKGRVSNGNDTLGLRDGKINYHYTYFSVS
ncbi:MAG: nuclear transport factor 2 family protein [Anaerolineales bacterium]